MKLVLEEFYEFYSKINNLIPFLLKHKSFSLIKLELKKEKRKRGTIYIFNLFFNKTTIFSIEIHENNDFYLSWIVLSIFNVHVSVPYHKNEDNYIAQENKVRYLMYECIKNLEKETSN